LAKSALHVAHRAVLSWGIGWLVRGPPPWCNARATRIGQTTGHLRALSVRRRMLRACNIVPPTTGGTAGGRDSPEPRKGYRGAARKVHGRRGRVMVLRTDQRQAMKIAIFAARYPVPYKPYYDSQFVDLIDRGHELVIYSTGALNEKLNEKVLRYGLQRRTRHFPATLRDVPRHLPAVMRGLGRAALGVGELRAVADAVDSGKRRAVHLARWFAIRNGKADLCLVHGLGTATLVPWAKRAVGDAPTALYYHGGEVPSVQPIPEALARDAFGRADIVFTNTEFSRRHAIERGCPEEKTAILPVGFDLRDF